ncbi:MAG: hypothetical protein A2046_12700 [Bacteroidetes bacterium GWA2_30_7]|nr:MAG: hypothetical protein A2046_12700 [Bacteroidetes bacterium GWA2_30_7]
MLKLAIKDLKLFMSDKRALLLTFIIPMALITLFAIVFGGTGNSESREYDLIVCDLDSTTSSIDAIAQLDTLNSLHIVHEQLTIAQDLVKKGKRDALLILHKGFGDSLANGSELPIELQYDEAKEAEVGMLQQSLYSTIMQLPFSGQGDIQKMMHNRFDKLLSKNPQSFKDNVFTQFDSLYSAIDKGIKNTDEEVDAESFGFGTQIEMTKIVAPNNDNSAGLVHAVAGTAIMMLLFSVAGIGASLLDEKQEGTLKKLLYSPINPRSILFGKMLYTNVISIAQLTIMFLYAYLVFGLDIMHHLPSLLIMIIATAYACSSFGVLLASFSKSRQQVQGLSTLIILVMSCIGGSMIPTFIMPAFMQKMSMFSVNYWGIQGFYDIFWRLLSITDSTFLSRILVLILIGTTLNLFALQMFKKNILKIV